MSIKQFAVFFLAWVLGCAFILEPAFICPLFTPASMVELAFNGNDTQLGELNIAGGEAAAVESLDYFRVICLLYFGLPAAVYLIAQRKEL